MLNTDVIETSVRKLGQLLSLKYDLFVFNNSTIVSKPLLVKTFLCSFEFGNGAVLYHTRIYTICVWYIPYTYTHMV